MITVKTCEDLKPVIKDQSFACPSEAYYYVLRPDVSKEYGKEPNITIVLPGRLGEEFNKTFGHYHKGNEEETYRVLFGSGLLLLQKKDGKGNITDVRVLEAKIDTPLKVPIGYGHALINTSNDLLITADWESEDAGHDYEEIKAKRGMAYYVIEEDGNVEFEKNPRYGKVPEITQKYA